MNINIHEAFQNRTQTPADQPLIENFLSMIPPGVEIPEGQEETIVEALKAFGTDQAAMRTYAARVIARPDSFWEADKS